MKTTKNILGLQLVTDPRWVDLASLSIEDILTDHAFCEQKAGYDMQYPDNKISGSHEAGI